MPETTFVDANVVTAAQLNQIEDQQVTTCTSSTRPTGVAGRVIAETDTEQYRGYDGSTWNIIAGFAWQTFTPSWTNVTLGSGPTNNGLYIYMPGAIRVLAELTLGTGGAATGSVSVTIPNSESSRGGVVSLGVAQLKDGSGDTDGTTRCGKSSTLIGLYSGITEVGATNPFTFAAGDQIIVDHIVPL